MLYTSGTTGFPKGALHSHRIIRNMVDAADRLMLTPEDKVVLYLPLFHVFGAAAVLTFLYVGGTIVLTESFEAAHSLELIDREAATIVYGIGTMYYDQIHHAEFGDFDLSSIRLCLAPGTGDLIRLVSDQMGTAINGYGMTETSSITALPNLSDSIELRADTVGYPLPGFDVRVVDPAGVDLPVNTTGELVVRGQPVMLGYYKNPDATTAVIDEDGWFFTGDAVQLTPEGYLRYMGRVGETLRVGGENVDPIEVEVALMRHPAVLIASVFGVPDDRLGEIAVAYVQLKSDEVLTESELITFVMGALASFKVPRRIKIIDELPKTGSGKVQKYVLREWFLTENSGRTTRHSS